MRKRSAKSISSTAMATACSSPIGGRDHAVAENHSLTGQACLFGFKACYRCQVLRPFHDPHPAAAADADASAGISNRCGATPRHIEDGFIGFGDRALDQ